MEMIDDVLLAQLKYVAWFGLPLIVSAFLWWVYPGWKRWLTGFTVVLSSLGLLVIGFEMFNTYLDGCYGAPKEVEFYQGMTLCPGQEARFTIELPPPNGK
jgi:hypothetical protein